MPSISFTPLSVASTAIRHRNASILKCRLSTGGGTHGQAEILGDNNVLIEVKAMLRLGYTLVPLIVRPDRTQLLNSAGDNKELGVYVTIGNLSSKIRQMYSSFTVVMVALQPIPITNRNIPHMRREEQWQTNHMVLNEVLRRELPPHTFGLNPSAKSGYYNVLCTVGNFTHSNLVLAPWLADCPEYCDVHYLERYVCVRCEFPKNELRDYVPSDKQHPRWDHNLYRILSDANPKGSSCQGFVVPCPPRIQWFLSYSLNCE
jgi:hypothetical protein